MNICKHGYGRGNLCSVCHKDSRLPFRRRHPEEDVVVCVAGFTQRQRSSWPVQCSTGERHHKNSAVVKAHKDRFKPLLEVDPEQLIEWGYHGPRVEELRRQQSQATRRPVAPAVNPNKRPLSEMDAMIGRGVDPVEAARIAFGGTREAA